MDLGSLFYRSRISLFVRLCWYFLFDVYLSFLLCAVNIILKWLATLEI
jgi:hypothetical protein